MSKQSQQREANEANEKMMYKISDKKNPVPIETLEEYLKAGADVNYVDSDGHTPLYYAALKGARAEVVKWLIDKGAKVDQTVEIKDPPQSVTPLYVAATWGYYDTCKILINAGADVNFKVDENGGKSTPLSIAILSSNFTCSIKKKETFDESKKRYFTVIQLLLENGAEVNGDYFGTLPLSIAVQKLNPEIVALCLRHGANPHAKDKKGVTALEHLACVESGNVENKNTIILMLQMKGCFADTHVLSLAITHDPKSLPALLEMKEKGSITTELLSLAMMHAPKSCLPVLLKNDGEINGTDSDGFTLFHTIMNKWNYKSTEHKDSYCYKEILQMDITAVGNMIKFLQQLGGNINAEGKNFNGTALRFAINRNNEPAIRAFLEAGAAITLDDLECGMDKDSTAEIRQLMLKRYVEQGNKLDTSYSSNVFHYIASYTNGVDLEHLIKVAKENGGDINAKSGYNKETPLFTIARGTNCGIAKAFVIAGADVTEKNCWGKYATSVNEKNHYQKEAIDYLREQLERSSQEKLKTQEETIEKQQRTIQEQQQRIQELEEQLNSSKSPPPPSEKTTDKEVFGTYSSKFSTSPEQNRKTESHLHH